jgi:hypothetical protein
MPEGGVHDFTFQPFKGGRVLSVGSPQIPGCLTDGMKLHLIAPTVTTHEQMKANP